MDEIAFLEAVDRCYSSLGKPEGMDALGRFLCRLFSARAGDIVTEAVGDPVIHTHGSAGFDDSFRTTYDVDFLGENPWAENLRHLPRGKAHTDAAEPESYWKSNYYNEWVRPQGLHHTLGAILDASPLHHTWVGLARDSGRPFSDEERQFLERLMPHLCRATRIAREIEAARDRHANVSTVIDMLDFAVFVADGAARLIEPNTAGQKLLDRPGPLWVSAEGRISVRGGGRNAALRAAIARAGGVMAAPDARFPEVIVVARAGAPVLVVDVFPLRCGPVGLAASGCVALFVHDLADHGALDLRALATAHALTGTECDLAKWLASGGSLRAFAERRGVSVGTVRWHLKNLEQKTGTRRVEELVALIHRAALPLHLGPALQDR